MSFRSEPIAFLVAVAGIVAVYLASAELVKAWFYGRTERPITRARA